MANNSQINFRFIVNKETALAYDKMLCKIIFLEMECWYSGIDKNDFCNANSR